MGLREAANEALGVSRPGIGQRALTLFEHRLGSAAMHIGGCQHRDAPMAVLGVVPREERSAVPRGVVDPGEATREAGVVFQGLELRFRERVVVRDLGSAQ